MKKILATTAALASCLLFTGVLSAQAGILNASTVFVNRLSIPPLLDPVERNGVKVYDLTLRGGVQEFLPGKKAVTFGINGSYLGPTLRLHNGDQVRMDVANMLGTDTTIHWHGMEIPAVMDGVYQIIKPDTMWEPTWTIRNQAATLWYHAHLMGHTGEQVYKGLAGLIIVDDANSESLRLPHRYGVDDIPVIVQDKMFDSDGQLHYEPMNDNRAGPQGFLGDTILVNGTYGPYVEAPRGWVRLRFLNASNARRFNIGFDDGRAFFQIGSDGGFLETPVKETRLVVGPASRVEILVDTTNGATVHLMSYAVSDVEHASGAFAKFIMKRLAQDKDENQVFSLLEIRPNAEPGTADPLPQRLNTILRPDVKLAVRTRSFSMDRNSKINGRKMTVAVIDQVVNKDDVEIWQLSNNSPNFHPFHVHNVQFLVVDINGKQPDPSQQGWLDTVLVYPGDHIRLLVQFKYYSDPHHPYMFHCHILEHEDMGMMGQFVVVDRGTKPEEVSVDPAYMAEYSNPMNMGKEK